MARLILFKKVDGSKCYINAEKVTALLEDGDNTIICLTGNDPSSVVVKGNVNSVSKRLDGQ